MHKIVLYCKSFDRDVDRVVNLWESIQRHNIDNIPFYISVPKSDIKLFKSKNLPNIIEDEIVYEGQSPGWIQQQIVKSNFWKLNISENYVCIDSDGYFIKDFYITDFMYNDENPYTVIHEQKELFTWTVYNILDLGFDPKLSYIKDRQKIMDLFGRKGKYYDFGPVPTIWSGKVWKSLEDNYIVPNNITWEQMLEFSPSEFSWYGEALLTFEAIKIYPVEPIFKVFHYAQQLNDSIRNGVTQEMISQNYLGIIMQSNFNAKLKY
jgi:hypothetical protein|tara:strand:+ start:646 stop:1437 length:792 start_codon:yes stop_codon:yes gene_type:complete